MNMESFSGTAGEFPPIDRPNFCEDEKGVFEFSLNYFKLLMKFDALDFYGAGVDSFNVDGIVFEVLEDSDDGYRSSLGGVILAKGNDEVFFRTPIARVKLHEFNEGDRSIRSEDNDSQWRDGGCEGYQLIDVEDGHIWLEFGTDMYDGYYPCFYFQYNPKPPISLIKR